MSMDYWAAYSFSIQQTRVHFMYVGECHFKDESRIRTIVKFFFDAKWDENCSGPFIEIRKIEFHLKRKEEKNQKI